MKFLAELFFAVVIVGVLCAVFYMGFPEPEHNDAHDTRPVSLTGEPNEYTF